MACNYPLTPGGSLSFSVHFQEEQGIAEEPDSCKDGNQNDIDNSILIHCMYGYCVKLLALYFICVISFRILFFVY